MKQNNQLTFSSRYRKQRTSITIRRRRRYCKWISHWSDRFSWRIACCWEGWNWTLTFRSYQNYRQFSSFCRTTSVFTCTIQHSAGLVCLQHHSSQQSTFSSQLWTAAHNALINMCNCLQVSQWPSTVRG